MSRSKRYILAAGVIAVLASAGATAIDPHPMSSPITLAREAEAVGAGVKRMRGNKPPVMGKGRQGSVVAYCMRISEPFGETDANAVHHRHAA